MGHTQRCAPAPGGSAEDSIFADSNDRLRTRSIACLSCPGLSEGLCVTANERWLRDRKYNPLRACVDVINQFFYVPFIQMGQCVLEVGCGSRSPIREHCLKVKAHWEGVDIAPEYMGRRTIATRLESVERLSFPSEHFDLVIGSQTLEHWKETGCRPECGLYQVFRVTKVGGLVLLNVPIYLHGSREFIYEDYGRIARLFEPYAAHIDLVAFRKRHSPFAPLHFLARYAPLSKRSAYVLDIRCIRADHLVAPDVRPLRFARRWLRELMDHDADYLLFKALRKLRIGLIGR